MQTDTSIETQLKDAAQLSQATWAVLAERVGGTWLLRSVYHLTKPAQNELMGMLATPVVDAWLCGALSGGYSRFTSTPDDSKLNTTRIYAFPVGGTSQSILVGADEMSTDGQKIWKLISSLISGRLVAPSQPFLPNLQTGLGHL